MKIYLWPLELDSLIFCAFSCARAIPLRRHLLSLLMFSQLNAMSQV